MRPGFVLRSGLGCLNQPQSEGAIPLTAFVAYLSKHFGDNSTKLVIPIEQGLYHCVAVSLSVLTRCNHELFRRWQDGGEVPPGWGGVVVLIGVYQSCYTWWREDRRGGMMMPGEMDSLVEFLALTFRLHRPRPKKSKEWLRYIVNGQLLYALHFSKK